MNRYLRQPHFFIIKSSTMIRFCGQNVNTRKLAPYLNGTDYLPAFIFFSHM